MDNSFLDRSGSGRRLPPTYHLKLAHLVFVLLFLLVNDYFAGEEDDFTGIVSGSISYLDLGSARRL